MSYVDRVRSHPSVVLLVVQLIGILVYPFLDATTDVLARTALGLFGLIVLFLAVGAVRASPALTWVAVLLGLPVIVLTIVDATTGGAQPWHTISDGFHAAFYAYTFYALVRALFADEHVTTDELFSLAATFTVGMWCFAYVYGVIQVLEPGAFGDKDLVWHELLFLSGTTMTNTGLSDMVPVLPHARSVVLVQEITGVLYIGMVISRVVGLTATTHGRHERPKGDHRDA